MSNSTLAVYRDTGIGQWNYRTAPISKITIHHAACVASMHTYSSIIRKNHNVSWNYAIANDGEIGIFVDEDNRSWASSNVENDMSAVTIIVSNSEVGGSWPVSKSAYNSLLKLCVDICQRNGISKLIYGGSAKNSNLTMHKWFTNTICPGPYLSRMFPTIAAQVNKQLQQQPLGTSTDRNYSYSAITGGKLITRDTINYKYLKPYIITINRNTHNMDYTQLKNMGVVGVIIEAGSLYDAVHSQISYRNPRIDVQCKSAVSAKLPFGLYCGVRARSVEEAKRELYELSFCIRKYPPMLGVWLHLQLVKSTALNNQILNVYYNELVRLGLKDKVGLYVTPSELKQISWDKFQDQFYLWLVEHVSTMDSIDQLLTPEFFVLPK